MKRSVLSAKSLVKSSGIPVKPMQRSLTMLSSACKSPKTYENYLHHINKFREYFIIKNFDALISIGTKKLQTMKLKLELEKKDKQLSSLEVKDRRIEDLENVLSRVVLNLNELKSRVF